VPFSAETRLSGVDFQHRYRKGAVDAVLAFVGMQRRKCLAGIERSPRAAARRCWCARQALLGAIHLKDVVKPGIRERFAELRKLGIRTVMVTGDNPLTAAAIAAEAGWMTCWPRPRRRRSWRASATSRTTAAWSPCAATAPTTPRHWPRLMSAWR
jgi:P-type E1-E2 ATPase